MGFRVRNKDSVTKLFRDVDTIRIIKIVERGKERYAIQEKTTFLFIFTLWVTLHVTLTDHEAEAYLESLRAEHNSTETIFYGRN